MVRDRLQKILARAGVASRREAERLVAAGRVTVNGEPAELGASADPDRDTIELDGRPVAGAPASVYYAVHKPAGMLSSARDERGRRSVVRLVPDPPARLWPAGRLDADSEGLMLLTNDGEWANRVIHPRYGLAREYAVLAAPGADARTLARLVRGVELDDGPARLLSASAAPPPGEVRRSGTELGEWLRVTVGEGRKREVRRLFEAVGVEVVRLVRTRIGPLTLAGLQAGEWRTLSPREVEQLAGEAAASSGGRAGRAPVRVAIDGPSGSGKSTVGREVARRLGAAFVDTGLIYRALALAALRDGIGPADAARLARLARETKIEVRAPAPGTAAGSERVLLNGVDVTGALTDADVDRSVSEVSGHAEVRAAMLEVQRRAGSGSVVMAGRDIGTVVLPEADLKVFLTSSSRIRAERRAAQLGEPSRVEEHQRAIDERDERDRNRPTAPLRVPEWALVLDTEQLDVEACVAAILAALPQRHR